MKKIFLILTLLFCLIGKYKETIEEGAILTNTGTLEIMEAYYAVTK